MNDYSPRYFFGYLPDSIFQKVVFVFALTLNGRGKEERGKEGKKERAGEKKKKKEKKERKEKELRLDWPGNAAAAASALS